ncbi:hypothetical protein KIPB_016227, partial [Kipferlia bialata]
EVDDEQEVDETAVLGSFMVPFSMSALDAQETSASAKETSASAKTAVKAVAKLLI